MAISFLNTNFKVLKYLHEQANGLVVKTTQREIAEGLNLSRATVNKTMLQLEENSYLRRDQEHVGRYFLTEKGRNITEIGKEMEDQGNVRV